jgi:hypothetical protein
VSLWSGAPDLAGAGRDLPATEQAEWGTGGEEEAVLGEERGSGRTR